MTRDEFEKKLVTVLMEATKEGFLHRIVIMADTRDAHIMLTNMGQRSTIRYLLRMGEVSLSEQKSNMVAYNLVTGEEHGEPEATVTFETGVLPKSKKKQN